MIDEDPAAPAAPPPSTEPERPAETRAEQPAAPQLDWRIIAPVAVAIVLLVAASAIYFSTRPVQQIAQPEPPASAVAEDAWAGLADYDRLSVRPLSMPRPIPTVAMQETMLSGFVDVDFTVGPDGKATDVRIIRESVEDIGYAREARRMVAGATWPTEWRGRAAPYAARFRVIFPPGRGAARVIAPISIASPNLTPEILALRRNASVTLLVRVNAVGLVESAQAIGGDVESAAVTAEALRVALGARFPPSSAGVGYETRLVVFFNVLGALGQSEEPPPGPAVSLSEVPFAQRPSDSDFSRHYPNRALRQGINGRVTLDCTVRRDLRLNCLIANEDPPNEGFGNAALRISRRFRAEPQFPDGRTTLGAQVTVPMSFRVE